MATLVAVVAGLGAVQGRAGRALAISPTEIRHSDAAVRKICSNPSLNLHAPHLVREDWLSRTLAACYRWPD